MSPRPPPNDPLHDANPGLPRSATHFGVNLVGVFAAIVALFVLRAQRMSGPNAVVLVCIAAVLPILVLDTTRTGSSAGSSWGTGGTFAAPTSRATFVDG